MNVKELKEILDKYEDETIIICFNGVFWSECDIARMDDARECDGEYSLKREGEENPDTKVVFIE